MTKTDYKDLDATPDAVAAALATMAVNAVHLATLLTDRPYPPGGAELAERTSTLSGACGANVDAERSLRSERRR